MSSRMRGVIALFSALALVSTFIIDTFPTAAQANTSAPKNAPLTVTLATTPTVTTWPSAAGIVSGQALSAATLSGGVASVPGTFAFANPATVPSVGTATHQVTFTPTDTVTYTTVTSTVTVVVSSAATPVVTTWPSAAGIVSGQALSAATLSGGVASVPGTFAFVSPTDIPAVGTATYQVIFTPTDNVNYTTVTSSGASNVSVTVTAAATTPPTSAPTTTPAPQAPVIVSGPRECSGKTAKSETVFNNPIAPSSRDGKLSNSRYAITNRLIEMVDCAQPGQTVAMSWFSFTDENLVGHLLQAHAAGVNVRILLNSHATKPNSASYSSFNTLRATLGSNITAANANASTNPGSWISYCNSGCLTPEAKAGTSFPNESEGEYPALHSKFFLVTQAGSAKNIVGISSMNPTYEQARVGFNNASIVVNDQTLFNSMNKYYTDLANAARGAGQATAFRQLKSESKTTSYYVYPKTGADDVLAMLKNIKCVYKEGGKTKRTQIYVNMFVFTRNAPAMELWRKAFNSTSSNGGCDVKMIYTDLDQRIKALNTRTGATDFISYGSRPSPWGVADCLSTKPQDKNGKAAKLTGPELVYDAAAGRMVTAQVCKFGSLQGAIPTINKGGGYCWFKEKSKISGGSLELCASTPYRINASDPADGRAKLEPAADSSGARWYTHQKYIAIDGMYANKRQKIVISGTPNLTAPGLRWNDEILTFTTSAEIYAQHLADFKALKAAVLRRPAPSSANTATASW